MEFTSLSFFLFLPFESSFSRWILINVPSCQELLPKHDSSIIVLSRRYLFTYLSRKMLIWCVQLLYSRRVLIVQKLQKYRNYYSRLRHTRFVILLEDFVRTPHTGRGSVERASFCWKWTCKISAKEIITHLTTFRWLVMLQYRCTKFCWQPKMDRLMNNWPKVADRVVTRRVGSKSVLKAEIRFD